MEKKEMEPIAGPSRTIDPSTEYEDDPEISEDAVETMMELNLGEHFVEQLDLTFGDLKIEHSKEFQPIIEIPTSLGRQLYALYLESIFNQMDTQQAVLNEMIHQDEEFAKQLQAQEEGALKSEQTEERWNLVLNQKDWEKLTPDAFVEKLTRNRLLRYFPEVDLEGLIVVMMENDNSYGATVSTLLESGMVTTEDMDVILKPVISESELHALRVAYNDATECIKGRDPRILRHHSQMCKQKREKLIDEANKYSIRGEYELAHFYHGLAKRQRNLYEQYRLLTVGTTIENKNPRDDTLDLHLLEVQPAIIALDMFLDNHIRLLLDEAASTSRTIRSVNIITGRGRHSPGGIPRIKPAVICRLRRRGIRFSLVNPGFLRVYICKNSVLTSNVNSGTTMES